jgi:hypothetical protein
MLTSLNARTPLSLTPIESCYSPDNIPVFLSRLTCLRHAGRGGVGPCHVGAMLEDMLKAIALHRPIPTVSVDFLPAVKRLT